MPINNSDLRYSQHAETVGTPVHRQRVVPGPRPDLEAQEGPQVSSLDGKPEWVDEPTFPDQIHRGPDYWKVDYIEAKVFDMTKEEDVKAYGELLTAVAQDGANQFMSQNERKFCDDTNNWRIFVEIQHVKFRKIITTKKGSNE